MNKVNLFVTNLIFVVFLLAVVPLVGPSLFASEQHPYDIEISPSFVRQFIKPGESFSTSFSIVNKGDPSDYVVSVRGVTQGENPQIIDMEKNYSDLFSIWIDRIAGEGGEVLWQNPDKLTKDAQLFIKSGQKLKVYLSTSVLSDAPFGETALMLSILKNTSVEAVENNVAMSLRGTTGIYILTTITDGNVQVKGSLDKAQFVGSHTIRLFGNELSFIDSSFGLKLVKFIVQLNNTGRYAYTSNGLLKFTDVFRRSHEFALQPALVLPLTKRVLAVNSTAACTSEADCYPDSSVQLGKQVMQFYSLSGQVELGKGASQIYFNRSLIVFPFTWIFLILLTIAVFFINKLRRARSKM